MFAPPMPDSRPASEGALGLAAAEALFKAAFVANYPALSCYAFSILKDEAAADEAVQAVFCRLWERADHIQLDRATKPYLYKAVHNECINQLTQARRKKAHHEQIGQATAIVVEHTDHAGLRDLESHAAAAVEALPRQCHTIFHLCRHEGLKYREVAAQLGISVKTVETQMTKALRLLREKLADYLPIVLITLVSFKY